jgi:hypothetical protein
VVAHAPGELPLGGQHLLHQGLWTDTVVLALLGLLFERPAGVREQVRAGSLVLGTADPEELRAGLRELSAAVGVGYFGTPCVCMQAEKATADGELDDPAASGEPPEPADDGLPPQAATNRARAIKTAGLRASRHCLP